MAERHTRGKKTTSRVECQTNRSFNDFSFIKIYTFAGRRSFEAIETALPAYYGGITAG